jgi:hypothetical protein
MRDAGVEVVAYLQAMMEPPDVVFPDWFTIQRGDSIPDGVFTLCPMCFPTRRQERDPRIIADLKKAAKHFIDLTGLEATGQFLEGKGSMIYDHRNNKIYCCLSGRASLAALELYLKELNKISLKPWRAVTFHGKDKSGKAIYHTDCMLALLNEHTLVCTAALEEPERSMLLEELTSKDKNVVPYQVIDLSFEEASHMCCNIMNVVNDQGESLLLMSQQAYDNYTPEHRATLAAHYRLVHTNVRTLEDIGGGSARCLLAEYF